ncbi:hypothetical protein [uncultured Flavobacterium sp.]|uniref:hypothetical protein n=1 Tax=uncultured Flavobacterium sp. TaxID=165435 RepID=UPI0025E37B15|nr:hypothetical protein [uncultured Flavobacterium sp.]
MRRFVITITFILALSADAGVRSHEIMVNAPCSDFRKIDITAVPAGILKSVTHRYEGYSLSEAWICEEDGFKLALLKDRKHILSFYKSTGEFIKDEVK